jgi:tetratricopeptide (TPR) repeat protein
MKRNFKIWIFAFVLFANFGIFATEKSALELFEEAQTLQNRGQWYDAVDLYQEALTINPQYGEVWYNLAVCSYALGSYDLAVQYADNASKYARNFTAIQNLKGMALISLGKVTEAHDVFDEILKKYPNDINARFGLAEIDLLDGRLSVAEGRYLDALKRDARNRKALLSLALVSAEMGKTKVSENYIRQALSYYSGEPEVHYMASYLAAKNGEYRLAEQRARSAVQINPEFDRAYGLLATILFEQKKFSDVIDICDFRIHRNRNLHDAWYLRGLSLERLNQTEEAIETFETGLTINPQDEIMRQEFESLLRATFPIEDSRRDKWAMYHYEKALEYGRNFQGLSERYEYQRALSIAPLNNEIRQSFAEVLERDGQYEFYLQQLKFIQENYQNESSGEIQRNENSPAQKKTRIQIKNDDAIESYESLMRGNLSNRWEIDPFYLDKTRWNIGIYYTKKKIQLFHADVEEVSATAAKEIFTGISAAYVDVQSEPVESFGEAFRLARTDGREYFVIMDAQETERTFSMDAQIYSARTGTKISEIHVYRTGNDCFSKAMQRFRQGVLDILPIRGKVLKNAQGMLLVDLGKNDGVAVDSEFDVVRKNCITTNDSAPGVSYNKKDLLGTLVLSAVDEEISEGAFKKKGFYDTLNVGDDVILTKNPDGSRENPVRDPGNRPAADSSGNPATDSARQAELESLKESLKPASRENDLLHLIR